MDIRGSMGLKMKKRTGTHNFRIEYFTQSHILFRL